MNDHPAGEIVAGRYRLERKLGSGGFGDVWAADDLVAGGRVAVKRLRPVEGDRAAWTRREIAALRLLRVPGVVRLLDEGEHDGRPYLVIELLEGTAFPGEGAACEWRAIEGPTLALLEILSRLHAEGVVHRDLKPDNVLVDSAGRPTILDFGIATLTFVPDRLTADGQQLGTPAYLAPEQLLGERPTAATDLYAVGVMMFEALTGRLPHAAHSFPGLVAERLTSAPPPMQTVAGDVPTEVADTVDWLLRRDPEERPRSAAEVIRALRREPASSQELAFLGRVDLVGRIATTLLEGRSFRLSGGRGMGKSRVAALVAAQLRERGRMVLRTTPADGPYGALATIVGPLESLRDVAAGDVARAVAGKLEEAFLGGAIVVADDADQHDRSSARLLASAAARWPVLWVGSPGAAGAALAEAVRDSHEMGPLSVVDLEQGLFVGPNRVLHLPEDAARELHRRTNGVPARIVAETRAWLRAGLAQRLDGRFSLERSAIERLTTDLVPYSIEEPRAMPERRFSERMDELLAWIELSDGSVDDQMLAELTGRPRWQIDVELDELVDTGACARASARLVALEGSRGLQHWSLTARRDAHARLACVVPRGTSARLRHLVLSRDENGVLTESMQLGERLAAEGALGRAAVALSEGFSVARAADPCPVEQVSRLLGLWVAVAVLDASTHALDRILYELGRAPLVADLDAMTALARAALALRASSTGGPELPDHVPPFGDPRLERLRQGLRVLGSRRRALAEEERVVAEVADWSTGRTGDPYLPGCVAGWLGRLRYRQGRYREATALHLTAADMAEWRTERVGALLNASSSALEDLELEQALELAERARAEAAACRHPFMEGRAEWLARCTRYRLGRAMTPDLELVDLASRVASDLEAVCATGEAAIAYRFGPRDVAAALARRAHQLWCVVGEANARLLSGAIAVATGAALDAEAVSWLRQNAADCHTPGVGIQTLALLAQAGVAPPSEDVVGRLSATMPRAQWGQRLDVLSVDEARAELSRLRGVS